jgi:hypothetical protein
LPANKAADDALAKQLKTLSLPAPARSKEVAANWNNKTVLLDTNKLHLQRLSFRFANDICVVNFKTDTGLYTIPFNAGSWNLSQTNKPGPSLTGNAIENTAMIYPAKVAGAYTWKDANTLQLVLRYIESPHTETFICHTEGNKLTVEEQRSEDFGASKTVIQGSYQ